jgi:hypothetical protein
MANPGEAGLTCMLFDRLRNSEGNLCFSPISVLVVLALCYSGARGHTAEEIRETLGFATPDETSEHFATLLRKLSVRGARVGAPVPGLADSENGQHLRIASRLLGRGWTAASCVVRAHRGG